MDDLMASFQASVTLAHATTIVRRHIDGQFKRHERASAIATSLAEAGLLKGGRGIRGLASVEACANHLQAVMSWPDAERAAKELDEAGLLAARDA